MSNLILYTVVAIAFGAFFAYVSRNALRIGIIKGGVGKPIHGDKQPKLFAVVLAATFIYCALAFTGAVVCVSLH